MVDMNLESVDSDVGAEIRALAENMLKQLEQGELTKAVALVNAEFILVTWLTSHKAIVPYTLSPCPSGTD